MRTRARPIGAAVNPRTSWLAASQVGRRSRRGREIARRPAGHPQLWTWWLRVHPFLGLRRDGPRTRAASSVAASLCEAWESDAPSLRAGLHSIASRSEAATEDDVFPRRSPQSG